MIQLGDGMRVLGTLCRRCGAGAGEPCNWTAPGFDGFFHVERFEDALGWLKPGEPPSDAAIMNAVERTGLV